MIEVRMINEARKADINLPNEPFGLFGRMEPSYADGRWGYKEILFDKDNISEMCFPDEDYDYEAMKENSVFLGAYGGEKCVGLAILQEAFFKYMYLYDLKVSGACRGQGVGRAL
ncbi:MAG: GNAT family N-acetyltransferase, partial [Oscillospiraceae bacterium]|nr:GNAT family N-acetyltransferase [Oscillospiraceae bacterium]